MEDNIQEARNDIEKLKRLLEALIETMGYRITFEDYNNYYPKLEPLSKGEKGGEK